MRLFVAALSRNFTACSTSLPTKSHTLVWLTLSASTTPPNPTPVCCDALNWVGGLWLGLLVVGCCGLPLSLAVFWWLGRMDKLAPRG